MDKLPQFTVMSYIICYEGQSIGAILEWSGNEPPNGWMICSGQIVSKAKYRELYAVIRDTYAKRYYRHNYRRKWYQLWLPKYEQVTEDIEGYFRLPDLTAKVAED